MNISNMHKLVSKIFSIEDHCFIITQIQINDSSGMMWFGCHEVDKSKQKLEQLAELWKRKNMNNDREKNLGVSVGDRIIHKNCEYVIVDVRCDEGMDGAELFVRAFDPNKADVEQQKRMKMEATSNNFLEMFKKLSEGGGPGGIMGNFGLGG